MKKVGFPLRIAAVVVLAASLAAEGTAAPQDAETALPASGDEAVMEVAEPAPVGVPEPKPSAVGFEIMGPNGERTVVPLDRLDGGQLTLAVGGRRYVCPLLAECAFADEKGQPMNRAAFAQRFLRRYVRVEMERTTGTVLSCRAM